MKNQEVQKVKRDISAQVLEKVEIFQKSGELRLPKDYSAENALKSAYLVLSELKDKNKVPVLQACTTTSIAESLLKMVVWGLSPLKGQAYFIPYGKELQCMPSYTGNILLAKRYGGLKDISAQVVLEGDEFEFGIDTETGRKKIIKHTQTLESLAKNQVKGAYAVMLMQDGTTDVEVMSMEMIRNAWNQGQTKGNSMAHRNFADQMAMRTVLNRACKLLIRTSDDSVLYDGEDDTRDLMTESVKEEVRREANKTTLDFDTEEADFEEVPEEVTQEVVEEDHPEQEQPDF